MDILRFITAGNVDDGKSTLIGRLLFDSKNIMSDQLETLEQQSRNKNADGIDLAILTDGLRAEREQGITIDVAYRYFSTPLRKFIVADAPGHVQYTRNMITGASGAQLIIILIDARHGVTEQTRRHSIIASLLHIRHVVVAVNKMDLAGFKEQAFRDICREYGQLAKELQLHDVTYIPMSAYLGDNIVDPSKHMKWYEGTSLLSHLEKVDISRPATTDNPRFQVQYVIRPQTSELHDYRGYAGQVLSGAYRTGDQVTLLPQHITTTISRLEIAGLETPEVYQGQAVTIHLEDDIDVSRGDVFAKPDALPQVSSQAEAVLCWLDRKELIAGNRYLLQQKSKTVKAIVSEVIYKLDVHTLQQQTGADTLKLNEIARVVIKFASPLPFDSFEDHSGTGTAILIDETSNATVAAVMIV